MLRSKVAKDIKEDSLDDSGSVSESIMEDSVADSATNTEGCEIMRSANADVPPNEIAKGIERLAEEANPEHMIQTRKSSQLAEDTDRLPRAPPRPSRIVPLQSTHAQAQPVVCKTTGKIQAPKTSKSADEREQKRA